jgi:hypothetical protein
MVGRWTVAGYKEGLWSEQISLPFMAKKFMSAVVTCAALEIRLPDASDITALKLLASQFEENTSVPVFRGCVGALDGMTVFIKAPTAAEAENVLAYYSGHYKCDSLNV